MAEDKLGQEIDHLVLKDDLGKPAIEVTFQQLDSKLLVKLDKILNRDYIREKLQWQGNDFIKVRNDLFRIQQVMDLFAPQCHQELEKMFNATLKRIDKGNMGILAFGVIKIIAQVQEINNLLSDLLTEKIMARVIAETVRKYGGRDTKKKDQYCLYPERAKGKSKEQLKNISPLACVDTESAEAAKNNPKIRSAEIRAHTHSESLEYEITKSVFDRILNEAAQRLVLYHGTHLEFLKSIIEKGLIAKGSLGVHEKGVYLTSDFETAARYGVSFGGVKIPVVLEIAISKSKRIKKLVHDPLDRPEEAWNDNDYGDDFGPVSVDELNSDIERTFNDLDIHYAAWEDSAEKIFPGFDESNIETLDGQNAYKVITRYIMKDQELPQKDRRRIMKSVISNFPPGTSYDGDFEISDDGTIKMTASYYKERHQVYYPKDLPVSTIKFVWVRISDFNLPEEVYLDTKEAGIKELAQETKGKMDKKAEVFKDWMYIEPEYIVDHWNQREIKDNLDTLEYFNDEDDLEKILRQMLVARKAYDEVEPYDEYHEEGTDEYGESQEKVSDARGLLWSLAEKFIKEVKNAEEFVYEDFYEEKITGITKWGKLPLEQVPKIGVELDYHPRQMKLRGM